MSDSINIEFGLDASGFISGARSVEDQNRKMTQSLMRAYQASARSANGLTDAMIATKAQTLLNLGATMEQVNAFKTSAVSLRQYKEELKRVGDEYQNDSAKLNAHMASFGKQNNLLSLATIRTRELKAEEAALAAQRAARATADAGKTARASGGRYPALSAAGSGAIDTRGLSEFNAKLDAATGKVKQLTVAILGIGSVKQLASMADEWTTVENRLKLVIKSTAELEQVRSQLLASANNTGQSIGTVAELYNKLATAQTQTGISGSKLLKLTDTINKSMVIGGGAAASQEAALVQLSQAFASGTLRGEELNSVLEQAPGLAQTLAKGLGVTVGQLRTLAAAGKLTSDVVANAILKQADDVNAQFAKMDKTIGQSATTLKNKVIAYVGALNESTGASRKAGAAMEWMGDHLGLLAAAAGTVAAVYAGKYAASVAMVIARKYAEIAASEKSVAAMLKEAAAARLLAAAKAGGAGAPASGAAGAGAGAASAGVAAAAAGAANAKGGWVGLAVGLATAAFAYYEVRQASKSVNSALQTQIGTLDELIAKYKQASDVEKQAMRKQAEDNYQQHANEFRSKLNDFKNKYIGLIGYGNTRNMPIANVVATINSLMADVSAGRKSIEEVTTELNKLFGIQPNSKLAGELAQQSVAINDIGVQANEASKGVNAMGGAASSFKTSGNQIAAGAQVASAAIQKLVDTQKNNIELLKKQKQLMAGGMSAKVAADVAKAETGEFKDKDKDELNKYTQSLLQQENLQKQIDNIKSVSDTLQSLGKSADEAKAELEGGKDGLTLFQLSMKDATSAQMEQAKQYIAQSKAYKEQAQNQQTLQGMAQQMQEAYAELAGGKSGLIAFRLGLTHATDEQIRQAQALNDLTDQIQRQKSVMTTLNSLQEQVATLGMDTVQRQLYSLRKDGATPEQLRYAEAMLKQIKSFDEAQKDTKLAAKDLSVAADALKDSSKAGDSNKKLSIFSKEYREKENARWKEIRRKEEEGGLSIITGRRPDAGINNINIPKPPTAFGSFGNGSGDIKDALKATEAIRVYLADSEQNVTFTAMFNAPGGAVQFKDILKKSVNSLANDSR